MKLFRFVVCFLLIVIIAGCSSGFCQKDTSGCERRIVGTWYGKKILDMPLLSIEDLREFTESGYVGGS